MVALAAAGFVAELVDSSMGMAYGVTCTTVLLHIGLAPAVASATSHLAEVALTLASGLAHLKLGNVDKKLAAELAVPGAAAAAVGAYALASLRLGAVSLLVTLYLAGTGVIIIIRSFEKNILFRRVNTVALAAVGGFLDATGGGGWGPIVTSTLVANGYDVKRAVGSVNLAEFFVTAVTSAVFLATLGPGYAALAAAVAAGGLPAAVIGAAVVRRASRATLMRLVGACIIAVNLYRLASAITQFI